MHNTTKICLITFCMMMLFQQQKLFRYNSRYFLIFSCNFHQQIFSIITIMTNFYNVLFFILVLQFFYIIIITLLLLSFIAAIPNKIDISLYENGTRQLKFKSLFIISFPGSQQYGAVNPCKVNESSNECKVIKSLLLNVSFFFSFHKNNCFVS